MRLAMARAKNGLSFEVSHSTSDSRRSMLLGMGGAPTLATRNFGGTTRPVLGCLTSLSSRSSHSSQARRLHRRLIKEFRGGIAFSLRFCRASRPPLRRGFFNYEIRGPLRTDLTIDQQWLGRSPEVGRFATNHQTEGYAAGQASTMIAASEP